MRRRTSFLTAGTSGMTLADRDGQWDEGTVKGQWVMSTGGIGDGGWGMGMGLQGHRDASAVLYSTWGIGTARDMAKAKRFSIGR